MFRLLTQHSSSSTASVSAAKINPQNYHSEQEKREVNDLIAQELDESSNSMKEQFTTTQKRLLFFYKFLLSNKFLLIIQAILFIFHTLLWFIIGMLEVFGPANFSQDYLSFGFNNFSAGCVMKQNNMNLLISLLNHSVMGMRLVSDEN